MLEAPPNQKPGTLWLVLINAGLWGAYFLVSVYDTDGLGLILSLIALGMGVVITTTGQVVVHFILRRRQISKVLRTVAFFVPTVGLVALALAWPKPAPRPNQVTPQASPSGKYVLTMPIERNPAYRNLRVWRVTISDAQGKVLYKDDASKFGGGYNAYWAWDEEDRVWFFNSDDGEVYFWELDGGRWVKTHWGYGRDRREIDRKIDQPKVLYPYAN